MDNETNKVTLIDRKGGRYLIKEPGGEPVLVDDENVEVLDHGSNKISGSDFSEAGSDLWDGSSTDGRG